MTTFLVERYLPDSGSAELTAAVARLEAAVATLRREGSDIRYAGSLFLPEEESCFCRFEGSSEEAVLEANKRADVPFARIARAVPISGDGARDARSGDRGLDDMAT